MKRALVDYPSSEDEEQPAQQQQKRSKGLLGPGRHTRLPPLSASLTAPAPVDNPTLHQGRVRTVPHVEGQYAAYIYVPLVLHHRDALCQLVKDALTLARTHVPSLHAIGNQEHDGVKTARWELHISLSRPLFLRAHQREAFKQAVKQAASSIAPFDASFSTFSELTNDERTRTFLALRVGAGHDELRRCLNLLDPTLRALRQKEFYDDPKFHASIAWALLEKTPPSSRAVSPAAAKGSDEATRSARATPEEQLARLPSPGVVERSSDDVQRIPRFPRALVPSLDEAYGAKLSQARTGGFVVDRIAVKIGRDVFTWPLSGVK